MATICNLNQAIWFENIDNVFQAHETIGYGMSRGLAIEIADFDNDNDMDVVTASINNDRIYWFENDEMDFTSHTITSTYDGAADVYPFDIDLDGDIDILSTAQYANKVSLWENQLFTHVQDDIVVELDNYSISNYPNPFNPSTIIYFITSNLHDFLQIEIYNLKGQKIKTLFPNLSHSNFVEESGELSVIWDGTDYNDQPVSSGIYLYKLKADGKMKASNKMILLK